MNELPTLEGRTMADLGQQLAAAKAENARLRLELDAANYRHGHLSACHSRYSNSWTDSPACDCGYEHDMSQAKLADRLRYLTGLRDECIDALARIDAALTGGPR